MSFYLVLPSTNAFLGCAFLGDLEGLRVASYPSRFTWSYRNFLLAVPSPSLQLSWSPYSLI